MRPLAEDEAPPLSPEPVNRTAPAQFQSIPPTTIYTYEWQQGSREYVPGKPIFFSDPNAVIVFHFDRTALGEETNLKTLYPRAEGYYEENGERTGIPVVIEYEETNEHFGEFRVVLDDVPKRNLSLVVHGREGRQPIEQELQYVEPFTAEWSGEDPYLNISLMFRNKQSIPWWTSWGSEQRLAVAFSAEADRASAEKRFAEIFGSSEWSSRWLNDRTAELTFRLDSERSSMPVHVDLNGVKSAAGYELQGDPSLQVYGSFDVAYGTLQLTNGVRKELFRTPQQFLRFLPNNDGTYALGQITQQDETGDSLYVLLDLRNGGELKKVFQLGELGEPQWTGNDPNTFIYGSATPEKRSVRKYEVKADRSEEIWSMDTEEERPFRWVRPLTIPDSERIWIMDYTPLTEDYAFTFSTDLYELSDIEDKDPEVTEDVHRSVCEGARCFGWFVPLSETQILLLQSTGNQEAPFWEYRLYDLRKKRHVTLLQEDGWLTALDDKRFLFIENVLKENQSFYRYSMYFPESQTREAIMEIEEQPGYTEVRDRAAKLGPNRFIVGDGVLDLDRLAFERLTYEPVHLNGDVLYWRKRLTER